MVMDLIPFPSNILIVTPGVLNILIPCSKASPGSSISLPYDSLMNLKSTFSSVNYSSAFEEYLSVP